MIKQILFITPIITFSSMLFLSQNSNARLNIITGGLSTGYDYNETTYDRADRLEEGTPRVDEFTKQLSLSPLIIYETSTTIDNITLRFNPSFLYDFEDESSDFNQNFSLSAYRAFTQRLRLDLSNNYIYSNDPELLQATNSADYNRGRRRYWTNDFNINSNYTYKEESSFGGGYTFRIMRNDDTGLGGYEDYDRHIADLSLQHKINASWNIGVTTSVTRGLFDPPDAETVTAAEDILEGITPGITDDIDTTNLSSDLLEYRAATTLNWILSQRKTAFLSYDFSATAYDAILRNDTNLHNLTIGGRYEHTRRLNFELGGGPSYENTNTFDPNWGYNAHARVGYDLAERTNFSFGGEKGYDQQNFSSNNTTLGRDQGLTDYLDWRLDFSHNFNNEISITAFGSYRDERQENILNAIIDEIEAGGDFEDTDRETFREQSVFSRQIYTAGGSFQYSFLRWYTAAINYTYRTQDSEQINDSYDEHRVYLTLSFEKELFRW
jgi:hypothetical protein